MDATTISKHCALLMPSLSRILENLEARELVIRHLRRKISADLILRLAIVVDRCSS